MSGRKPRTSRSLILITVLLCVIFGATFTQSSANPSPISDGDMPDMFVAEKQDDFSSGSAAADSESFTDDSNGSGKEPSEAKDAETKNNEAEVSAAPEATETPKKSETVCPDASPEASKGVWTASGSSWCFLVDGAPYTGWLCDTDGKHYFFDKDGIMQTGWLDDGGKRYYLDLDGIMQTGNITVGKKDYHLLEDGSLEGYTPTPTPAPKKKKAEASSKKKSAKKTDAAKKTVALTFDDGPSSFTDRLLDSLEENNAKATFFMVGQEIQNFPDAVKRMEKLGCELGNHTYSHVDLTTVPAEKISEEIAGTDQALMDLVGHGATVLRPPYGSINDDVVASVGTPMIIWSIDTLDWETMDVQSTVDTVLENVEDGSVILMHDIFETSVEAAEILIPKLIDEGYDLVTVHELAAAHGKELKTGIAYGAMNN